MRRASTGFTLIDVVIAIALLLVLFLSLFGVLRASLLLSTLTKAKTAGVEVANAQMEYLRGLTYDSLGTVGGIPNGIVPQFATSTIDGITYVTRTYIQYQDDPADGVGIADTNHVTTDFKNVKVTASYSVYQMNKSITLVSNFVPAGIETSNGGGTLSIHIVGATGQDIGNATVQITNTATTPTINLSTVSDANGLVVLGGAATSTQYQIAVSKAGYSSAQTYARAGQNVNPNPGYLTVAKDLTTGATFGIDQLANETFASFSPATTTTFFDTFASDSNLTSEVNVVVSGGAVSLATDMFSGSILSIPIAPSYLDGWGLLAASVSQPSNTAAVIHVADATGTLLPDAALPGNAAGFTTFPVSLTALSTTTYPTLTLKANLTRVATSSTVSLLDWSLSHTEGPSPLSNLAFTLTGAKTIGTDANSHPIFKTVVNDTTDSSGIKIKSLEWDAYTVSLSGKNLFETCPTAPVSIAPLQASTTSIIAGTLGTYALPVMVLNMSSTSITNATVVLTKAGFAATLPTSQCGLAFFNTIPSGTYTATIAAPGHTTKAFPNIVVAGNATTSTLTLP